MIDVGKTYGAIRALKGINLTVSAGEVTCVLGDNGAGKSTLIKIIAGLHPHNEGTMKVDGEEVHFCSPRESLGHGIATVYQDLAVVGLMEVWRNFFLGSELTSGKYPLRAAQGQGDEARSPTSELRKMGIVVKDINQPIGTLSGGQRQCVAIARAVYFGARVLILDEPTAALGVKQSGVVLKYTAAARDAGLGVVFITHNPHHAYLVGNHFVILKLGQAVLDKKRSEVEPRRADPPDGRRRRADRALARAAGLRGDRMTVAVAHQIRSSSELALTEGARQASYRGTDLGGDPRRRLARQRHRRRERGRHLRRRARRSWPVPLWPHVPWDLRLVAGGDRDRRCRRRRSRARSARSTPTCS